MGVFEKGEEIAASAAVMERVAGALGGVLVLIVASHGLLSPCIAHKLKNGKDVSVFADIGDTDGQITIRMARLFWSRDPAAEAPHWSSRYHRFAMDKETHKY